MKNEIRDMLIASAILSAILFLPSLFSSTDPLVEYGVSVIIQLLFLLYLGNMLAKAGAFQKHYQEPNWKHLLILLPTITLFLAVPVSCLCDLSSVNVYVSEYAWLVLLSAVLTAINDELLFRMIIYSRVKQQNRLLKIFTSAGIFALFELINFIYTFDVISTLISMVIAFILGVFLGFIVEYGHSIYPAIIFHFLYLFFTEKYTQFFFSISALVVILDLIFTLFAIVYLALSYVIYFRKKE